MPKIIVEIHQSIAHLPNIQKLKEQFIQYKSMSYEYAKDTGFAVTEFLPTLSVADQEAFPPDHQMFGKDKLFEGPQRAIQEQLFHVHLFRPNQQKTYWHTDEKPVMQWECTSDSALVYSHIPTSTDDSLFLFIRVIDPGAHDAYKQPGLVEKWAKLAQDHRCTVRR